MLYYRHIQLSWKNEDLVEEVLHVYHGLVVQVVDLYAVLNLGDGCRSISVE